MKRVLLVNPHESRQSGFTNPPIGLLYLAGTLLENGIDVRVVDGGLDGKQAIRRALEEYAPSHVGITALTPGRLRAAEIADMAKNIDPAITVILGGVHPTIMYQQMMEHYPAIEYIVLGEGEKTCLEIVQGIDPRNIPGIVYRNGSSIVKTHQREICTDLDGIPFPAWHLVDLQRYPPIGRGTVNGVKLHEVPRISVVFSRGCSGHCDFCSTWWIWRKWRHRSAGNMIKEIELLYHRFGIRHFCFADDAMTVDREATIELCDLILRKGLKIAFHVTTRTDCVDSELLHKLKIAGCYKIAFGIETASPQLLAKMGKANDVETSEKAIRLAKEAGIAVTALMIVGNVGETWETIKKSEDFLKKARPDEVGCTGGLWIFPGTKLYRDSKKQGFIDDAFWLGEEPYKIYTMVHSLSDLAKMERQLHNYNKFGFAGIFHSARNSISKIVFGKVDK